MRPFIALAACSSLVALMACSESAGPDEGSDESQGAIGTSADFLSVCPALEGEEFSMDILGERGMYIKATYNSPGYTFGNQVVPPSRQTYAAPNYSVYNLTFYRDGANKTKFRLSFGTYAGVHNAIEGAQRLTASGTVKFDSESGIGELVITSRRDALRRVVGDLNNIRFVNNGCSHDLRATLPIVTLDKASDATELVEADGSGPAIQSFTKVKWVKKADAVELVFGVPQG
jgi:hypothetical protein